MSLKNTRMNQILSLLIVAALLAAVVAAVMPSQAQAANCSGYYTVKTGDTLRSIARKFGVNLAALAKANRMSINDTVAKGERLCIPATGKSEPKAVFTVSAAGGKIYISGSGFLPNTRYLAKARQTDFGIWYQLGRLNADSKGGLKATSYPIPTDLKKKLYLTVCLKNQTNDSLTCRSVLNVP